MASDRCLLRRSSAVEASLASIGTTPWSVITAKFSSSFAICAMAAHTEAKTSVLSDLSEGKFGIS